MGFAITVADKVGDPLRVLNGSIHQLLRSGGLRGIVAGGAILGECGCVQIDITPCFCWFVFAAAVFVRRNSGAAGIMDLFRLDQELCLWGS